MIISFLKATKTVLFWAIIVVAFSAKSSIKTQSGDSIPATGKRYCDDWQKENFLSTLYFPRSFIFGVAESDFQVAGPNYIDSSGIEHKAISNWWPAWLEKKKIDIGNILQRWIPDVWRRDYALVSNSGFNAMRIEAPWSKIEPEKGKFNVDYINNDLKARVEYLQDLGLEVWISLSHFVWPKWFDDKGAFEKAENIQDFVDFARRVYVELPNVKFWITFNEPLSLVTDAYWGLWYNKLAPGKKQYSTKLAASVLKNILDAHVATYHALKSNDPKRQIGIIDHFIASSIEKQGSALYYLLQASGWGALNDVELNYFKTGQFSWSTILGAVKARNDKAIGALDFIGINYYSLEPVRNVSQDDVLDEKGNLIYPQGLINVIKKCSSLGKPIYITENGVGDAKDVLRNRYIKQHLCVVSEAIKKGYDVRGYFYWTFMDTLSWNGYTRRYGLYAVDFANQTRTLRAGAQDFIAFLQKRKSLYWKTPKYLQGLRELMDPKYGSKTVGLPVPEKVTPPSSPVSKPESSGD